MSKVTQQEFVYWKNDPITKKLMDVLREIRENCEQSLLDNQIILGNNAQVKLAFIAGQRDGLDLVLNMSIDDFDEDNDEEESKAI